MRAHHWAAFVCGAAMLVGIGCEKKEEAIEILPSPPVERLQHLWQIPDFTLTERSGKTVTQADLRGKVWLADFFYTTCPGPCPMLTSRLSEIQKALSQRQGVVLASISTDPQKDTIEVLNLYAGKFGAGENWMFLRGEKAAIYELANKGFKLSVTEEGGTAKELITHSTKLALVDKNGTVRAFYDAINGQGTAEILRDIDTLLKETR